MNFKDRLLQNKKVAIWGIGYLGYSTVLRLQTKGFKTIVYDFSQDRLKELKNKKYPSNIQLESWSKNGKVPQIDLNLVEIAKDEKDLFSSNLHIIAYPFGLQKENDIKLIKIFKDYLQNNSLILFQSSDVCCMVEKFEKEVKSDIGVAFRDDWNIEEFLTNKDVRAISGNNQNAISKTKEIFDLFNIEYKIFDTIFEAEIYIYAKNSLKFITSSFLNEMIMANSDKNLLDVLKLLNQEFGFSKISYKNTNFINNLLQISQNANRLLLPKEAQSSMLNFILFYADTVIQKGFKKALILGVSSNESLKDIKVAPSFILAEYLKNNGIEVFINDPNFSEIELKELFPFANIVGLTYTQSDVIFVLNDYIEYKKLSFLDIKNLNFTNAKLLIDSVGVFKDFNLPNSHIFGEKLI